MRLIAKFESKEKAKRFLAYLNQENCPSLIEHDQEEYTVWIYDEDQVDQARQLFEKFSHPEFNEEIKQEEMPKVVEEEVRPISEDPIFLAQMQEMRKRVLAKALYQHFHTKVTRFFVIICIFFLMMNVGYRLSSSSPSSPNLFTPIDKVFCYDVPIDPASLEYAASWQGYYSIMEGWPRTVGLLDNPKFTKIKQGEVWRLFTPSLLHAGLIHLLFNMLWFWILGKQIEERLSQFRYVLLIILSGVFSNTIQYLMSGANFIGFSGVVCALAGFIWMKQKIAPWEGYPVPKSSLNFLFLFIFGVGFVQLLSFLMNYFQLINLPINIANSAHISGLLFGAFLGRLHYFDRKKK